MLGVADQRGGIARQELLSLADSDDQGTAQPGAHDDVGVARTDNGQAVSPLQERESFPDSLRQISIEVSGDELGDHLGVGVASEHDAFGLELALQDGVVLDDAIVHDRDEVVATDVWMGVNVVGRPMRCPAGVADAMAAGGWPFPQVLDQVGDPAGVFADVQVRTGDRRHPGAVVPPILQSPKPFDQNRLRFSMADIADDSAHLVVS